MMRGEEEEVSWFARWEEELPSPEELMPLSQTLITPDLALAFDIPTPITNNNQHQQQQQQQQHNLQADLDSSDLNGSGGAGAGGADEPARTLKRPRLVWTPQLHKRFVDAVAHLGIKNAVPKTIMQLMSVDGLTRENVASHLQKYRLYLKRMQGGLGSSSSSSSGANCSAGDAATDQLFASAPIPHHFLRGGGGGGGGGGGTGPAEAAFIPFVPVAALQHHQQMVAAAQQQQQFYHHRQHQQQQIAHFGSPVGFDHGYLTRGQPQLGMHRMVPPVPASSYVDDLEEGSRGGGGSGGGRRVLTLFPTGED